MYRRAGAVTAALAVCAIGAAGCGNSTSPTNQKTSTHATATNANRPASGPLTRAQLIAKGDEICYRLNTRRQSTTIGHQQDYERVVPELSAYELSGATEMSQLRPPDAMAHAWQTMITDSRIIAEITGRYRRYGEVSHKEQHPFDVMLGNAINELVTVAKREGFKECSHFL